MPPAAFTMDLTAGTSTNAPTADELEDEIVFEKVMLDTLIPTDYDYETQWDAKMNRIEEMEATLDRMRGWVPSSSAGSMHTAPEPGNMDEFASLLSPLAAYNAHGTGGDNIGQLALLLFGGVAWRLGRCCRITLDVLVICE